MFLERNLYPNSMLINVKILIPPSTGIQGGGQQGVPQDFPVEKSIVGQSK